MGGCRAKFGNSVMEEFEMKFFKKPAVLICIGFVLCLLLSRYVNGTRNAIAGMIKDGPVAILNGPVIPGQKTTLTSGLPARAGFGAWFDQGSTTASSATSTPMVSVASKYVGVWNDHFAISESKMIINADGTGSASGFIFRDSTTFKWHEEGDHIVIENWQGRCEFNYAKITPDGKTLRASGPDGQNPFYKVEEK